MIATHGEEIEAWVKGIANNPSRKPQGGDTDQSMAVAAGEGDVGIVNHYYLLKMRDGNDEAKKAAFAKLGMF